MSTPRTPSIRIFRPGQFVSAEKKHVSFSEADLRATLDAYDPVNAPAPLVVGHPRHNDPAYGWVDSLQIVDGELVAVPGDIDPAFAAQVNAKRYRKISAQFFPPDHPSNPKPGVNYLKHVGFLGAVPPAVTGLGTVSFSDADDENVAIITTKAEDAIMPDNTPTPTPTPTPAPTPPVDPVVDTRETELAAREATIAERERQAAERDAAARHDANVSFATDLIEGGRLLPAGQALVVGLLDEMEGQEAISFGTTEADEMTPAAALKKLLDSTQPLISFGAHLDSGAPEDAPVSSFSAPPGYSVDEESAQLHAKAKALQAKSPDLSFADAVTQASAAG